MSGSSTIGAPGDPDPALRPAAAEGEGEAAVRESFDWVTLAEAAAMLGITVAAVRKRLRTGRLPGRRVGSGPHAVWLIPRAVLTAIPPGRQRPGPKPGQRRTARPSPSRDSGR